MPEIENIFRKKRLPQLGAWRTFVLYEDFLSASSWSGGLASQVSGTGAAIAALATPEVKRVGVVQLTTGTTASGRAGVSTPAEVLRLSGGGWLLSTWVRLTTLSSGTERYTLFSGFGDVVTADPVDGVYFRYSDNINSGKWQGVTRSNSSESVVDTTVTVAAGTWYLLEVEVNPAGTLATFRINGNTPTTLATNIPIAAGRETGIIALNAIKSVGTTARTFDLDAAQAIHRSTVQR